MGNLERRTFLQGAIAAVATGAASAPCADAAALPVTAIAVADPLRGVLVAYRDELNTLSMGLKDDEDFCMEQPVFDFMRDGELPVAATRETAIDALRLVLEEDKNGFGDPMITGLVSAALGYLEVHPAA